MADEVKPALAAEEWANVCVEGECRNDALWEMTRGWDPFDPDLRTVEDLPHHALAALALHGQPFGFTREDVAALQMAIGYDPTTGHLSEALESLAARIAALLPPEPTP